MGAVVRALAFTSEVAGSILSQSRSQSMPVRGLRVGIALAKPNEICNFIGCREINETDIGSKQHKRGISAGIMRGNAITM